MHHRALERYIEVFEEVLGAFTVGGFVREVVSVVG
jgi:hypothetical protein